VSTPVTDSLNVTVQWRVDAFVGFASERLIAVTYGGVVSELVTTKASLTELTAVHVW
jgi:hypothetical protein